MPKGQSPFKSARGWLRRGFVFASASAALLLVCGFALFVWRLEWAPPPRVHDTDGAVVLTGGTDRISEAVNLVARGYAARLLITGVNETVRSTEIARLTPEFDEFFKCCIDLDYKALNTEGNAMATRQWARGRAMHSLIVVTSNYHMPRAMLEMRAALPDVTLIAYPVLPDAAKGWDWFLEPQLVKVLVLEYLKYLRALVRLNIAPPAPADDTRTQSARLP